MKILRTSLLPVPASHCLQMLGRCCLALSMLFGSGVALAQRAPLTVVTEEYAPLSFTVDGKLRGYSVDITEALLRRANLPYTLRSYPWARAYDMALTTPNVLIFSLARTAERDKLFHWIGPLARRRVYFYKMAARKDLQVKSLTELKRYTISVNRGDIVQIQLRQLGLEMGKQIDLSDSTVSSLQKMVNGRVDFIVSSEFSLKYLCERAGVPAGELERSLLLSDDSDYYIAASLGTPQPVVDELKRQFEFVKDAGLLTSMSQKYGVK